MTSSMDENVQTATSFTTFREMPVNPNNASLYSKQISSNYSAMNSHGNSNYNGSATKDDEPTVATLPLFEALLRRTPVDDNVRDIILIIIIRQKTQSFARPD